MTFFYRTKLLVAVVLLTSVSIARADLATYNLGPYTFPDILNPSFTDTLSGTVTLTNNAGSVFTTYNAGDASLSNVTMSAQLTMQSSNNAITPVTISAPATSIGADAPSGNNYLQIGSLTATSSGLFLSNPGYFNIDYEIGSNFPPYIDGHWDTAAGDDGGAMFFAASPGGNGGAATMEFFPQNLDSQSPPTFGSGSWKIATAVPEPSTIALLTLGAIGLLFARRRFAHAVSNS
jgi:PEP-CTERM motif